MGARSKGCISCKARRVKCDETHPICQRCQKAGIECKGYASPIEFIDETSRVKRAVAIASSQQASLSSMRSSTSTLYHTSHIPQLSENTRVPSEMPLAAFKHSIYLSYLSKRMSDDGSASGIWVGESSTVSHNALDALAAMIFGQAYQSLETIVEARKAYGKALIDLRAAISNSRTYKDFDILACVTALCMYEGGVDNRSNTSWYHHANGLIALMQFEGPSKYQNKLLRSFFLAQRVMVVSKAILSGSETFLSEPSWKTIPWQNDPTSKEPQDYLVDIFCDVAAHQAELREWIQINPDLQAPLLKGRVVSSLLELDVWWEGWWEKNRDCCWEPSVKSPNSFASCTSIGNGFPSALGFEKLGTAFTVATYDSIRILLLLLLQNILQAERQNGHAIPLNDEAQEILNQRADRRHYPLQGITSNNENLAREICQTFEYCNLNSDQQFMCSFSCMFALDIAYSALDPDSAEANWIISRTRQPKDSLCGTGSTAILPIKVLSSCQIMQEVRRQYNIAQSVFPA